MTDGVLGSPAPASTRPGRLRRRLILSVALLLMALSPASPPARAEAPTFTINAVRDAAFDARAGGPLFALFIGTDARAGFDGERGDAIHLVGYNPAANAATVLNIPRDTWVDIPGHGRNKLTMAYYFGRDQLLAQVVGGLVGVPISYVVSVDFAGFQSLVDEMGGVDVHVPFPMDDKASGAVFPAGMVHMTGGQALAFSRNRNIPDGDLRRSENQGWLMLSALAKAKAEASTPAGTLRLVGIMARHARWHGGSWTDAYRLARMALALDPAGVRNANMPARIGFVGPQAVVFPGPSAGAVFADFRDDAVLQAH